MRLIAYANLHEVEHIFHKSNCVFLPIGVGFSDKSWMPNHTLYSIDEIILFGSCGLLQNKKIWYSCNGDPPRYEWAVKLNELIAPNIWVMNNREITTDSILDIRCREKGITVDYSVRKNNKPETDALIVDQESYTLGKWCHERGIKFQSVRYVIDKCGRIYLPGINKIWKKRQHKRMQLKFLELLNGKEKTVEGNIFEDL